MEDFKDRSEPLIEIKRLENGYKISKIINDNTDHLWKVVKFSKIKKLKGQVLKEGDWVKLGKAKFYIKRIVNNSISDGSLLPILTESFVEIKEKTDTESLPCRICLVELSFDNDPLIAPCRCNGTMKYIHISCLREWLRNKLNAIVSEKAVSYHWKDMSCELCMSKLPLCFRISGKIFHVLGFSQINKPYIVLEDFRSELRESRGAYIISIENGDYVILGRGQSCEIKLNDISISRKHSKIKLVDNQFYIEDLESKFGTLVSLNNNTKLNKNQNLSLQINRTLLHLFVKQPINCLDLFTMCKSIRVEPIEDLSRLTYEENLEDSNAEILKRNNRSIYIININDRYDSMVGSNIIPSLTTPLSDI